MTGFRYIDDFISEDEEVELLRHIERIEFGNVVMHGVVGRRKVAHYGWVYGYESWKIQPGPPIPRFLMELRQRAAAWIGIDPEQFAEVLVSQYPPGATIGWHRDAPMFGDVVGISLGAPCRFRMQKGKGDERQTFEQTLLPRSAYALQGEARNQWQHHIPAVSGLRYSITFRTLRRR